MLLPHLVFTTQEIRFIEQEHAAANGGYCFDLMEKAGRAVFEAMRQVIAQPRMVYILVGKGNNGGDGYIMAAILLKHKIPFRIFAVGVPYRDAEAYTAFSYFTQLGGQVEYELPDLQEEMDLDKSPDVVIDALIGTGLESAPRDPVAQWIDFINSSKAYVISVDVPSGINADTGTVYVDSVMANKTVCMLGLKPGLLTGDAVDYVGEIVVCDLGVNVASYHGKFAADFDGASYLPIYLTNYEENLSDMPMRMPSAHKGDAGRVLVIGGNKGFGGAISLCAQGALRAGAGLIKVATYRTNISAINSRFPELMTVDLYDDLAMQHAIQWADVIAIGPGLGLEPELEELLDNVFNAEKPTVVDADALNIMARVGLSFRKFAVMTPHPREAARLLGTSVELVNQDRYKAVYDLQKKCGGVVLLKGAGTLVCDGNSIMVIQEGSPAMASGGMGDLLTGIIAALRAEGLSQLAATIAGACIHGRAGYLAGKIGGEIGTIASDLLPYVRLLVNQRLDELARIQQSFSSLTSPSNGTSEQGLSLGVAGISAPESAVAHILAADFDATTSQGAAADVEPAPAPALASASVPAAVAESAQAASASATAVSEQAMAGQAANGQ